MRFILTKNGLNFFKAILKIWLVCLVFTQTQNAFSQQLSKNPLRRTIDPPQNAPLLFHSLPKMQVFTNTPPPGPDMIPDSTWFQISFDWTLCLVHRVDNTSPIEVTLSGTIVSNSVNIWNLFTVSPQPGGQPLLYFVEDVLGRTGPAFGTDIPLTWEISLDGGPFTPMTLQPNNTLTATFPPGPHAFQVRITGMLQPSQEDGYYHLQLEQCLVPEL